MKQENTITGIEVNGTMYDVVDIGDKGYVCANCEFIDDDLESCPIDPLLCEKTLGQRCLIRRDAGTGEECEDKGKKRKVFERFAGWGRAVCAYGEEVGNHDVKTWTPEMWCGFASWLWTSDET